MRVLITGAAGFIGSHLADAMLFADNEVAGIDNLSTGRQENVPAGVDLTVGDIRQRVPRGKWDLIFHCAASYRDRADWEGDATTNVDGTIAVVREAMRAGAKLVYFQTSLCYGPAARSPISPGDALAPQGSYAVSKTAGEAFIRDSGVEWVSLRLANIYGPRNLSGPPPTFYQRLAAGKPCTVVDTRRDFVYIDDLVDVAQRAAAYGQGVYHVSSGSDHAIVDLYHAVADAMGNGAPEPEVTPRGEDDVASLLLDPAETFLGLGWKASTPLAAGIARAVAWYETHGVTETFTHLKVAG
jgi:UDP-glucose 4-epimerase